MTIQRLIEKFESGDDEKGQLKALEQLKNHVSEQCVLEALCAVALKTTHFKLRQRIIAALKAVAEKANSRFEKAAAVSDDALVRRWALLNLSLMECRTARETVMRRLRDPDRAVQQAAALNAGLYTDSGFLTEIELYFERNRFALVRDCACKQMAEIGRRIINHRRNKVVADSYLPDKVPIRTEPEIPSRIVVPTGFQIQHK